jgi:hypothetical protein
LRPKLQTGFPNGWLRVATPTMSGFARFFLRNRVVLVFRSIGLTDILLLAETPDELEALFAVTNGESVSQLFGLTRSSLILHNVHLHVLSNTYINCFDFPTIVTDGLQDLLDLSKKACVGVSELEHERLVILTIMVDRHCELDSSKMARTLSHVFFAGGTFEVAIDSTQMRVIETFFSRPKTRFILQFYEVRNMLQVTRFAEHTEQH